MKTKKNTNHGYFFIGLFIGDLILAALTIWAFVTAGIPGVVFLAIMRSCLQFSLNYLTERKRSGQ